MIHSTFIFSLLFSIFSLSSPLQASESFPIMIELPQHLDYETIASKVQPSITYGIIKYDCNGFKKDDLVEILEDVCQGHTYCVRKDSLTTWIYADAITIIPCDTSPPLQLTWEELEYYMNYEKKSSQTSYYIWVDLSRQLVYVFFNPDNAWILIRQMSCATGKPTTPTARGTFTILDRGAVLRSEEHVKYWVKFYKNYLFHSLPLTVDHAILDSRIGEPISNGCVRLLEEDAKWLFDTIPQDTAVWIY